MIAEDNRHQMVRDGAPVFDLHPSIDAFYKHLLLQNMSVRTATEYRYDAEMFVRFLADQSYANHVRSLSDIHEEMIADFVAYLRTERQSNGHPISAKTVNRKLCAIRSFFNFLIEKRRIHENPTALVKPIKETKTSSHTFLSDDQAVALIGAVRPGPWHPRDLLIVELMLFLGLRVSEVTNLNLSDINLDTQRLTVHGKGNKERVLPLDDGLIRDIQDYLQHRTYRFTEPKDRRALFLSRQQTRLTVRSVQLMLKEIVDRLGFNKGMEDEPARKRITCHKLRHTCATSKARNGVSILTIQKLLGHQSVTTTQIYAEASDQQVQSAIVDDPIYRRVMIRQSDS